MNKTNKGEIIAKLIFLLALTIAEDTLKFENIF